MKKLELRQLIREEIKTHMLKEYVGPNFLEPLVQKIKGIDEERIKIRKIIQDNDFSETTVDRTFSYVEEFLDKAVKYTKLASDALDKVRYEN